MALAMGEEEGGHVSVPSPAVVAIKKEDGGTALVRVKTEAQTIEDDDDTDEIAEEKPRSIVDVVFPDVDDIDKYESVKMVTA